MKGSKMFISNCLTVGLIASEDFYRWVDIIEANDNSRGEDVGSSGNNTEEFPTGILSVY